MKGLVAVCLTFCLAASPVFAQQPPKGMVPAYGRIDSDSGPIAELSGYVRPSACRIKIPPMWRADKGNVFFSYRCTK